MLTDTAAIAAAERLKAQAGARVHRLGQPEELTEDSMPRGVYDRSESAKAIRSVGREIKKKIANSDLASPPKASPGTTKKRGRKPGVKYAKKAKLVMEHVSGPKFGVFDDGSVTLNLPGCKGTIVPQEAREFLSFLAKIGVKA